jgi:hypothetical protein
MKAVFIIVSILIMPGTFFGFIDSVKMLVNLKYMLYPLLIGFSIGVAVYYLLFRRFHGIQNFEHEFTHAFVALLFFRRIKEFVSSSSEGGYVRITGGFGGELGDLLITLGPYFLPTFAFIMALARPFVPSGWFPWYDGGTGFMLAYHTVSTIDEIKRNYSSERFKRAFSNEWTITDINQTGFITATLGIISLTLLVHGIIFFLHSGGYVAVWFYFRLIFNEAINLIILLYGWLSQLVAWAKTV